MLRRSAGHAPAALGQKFTVEYLDRVGRGQCSFQNNAYSRRVRGRATMRARWALGQPNGQHAALGEKSRRRIASCRRYGG